MGPKTTSFIRKSWRMIPVSPTAQLAKRQGHLGGEKAAIGGEFQAKLLPQPIQTPQAAGFPQLLVGFRRFYARMADLA